MIQELYPKLCSKHLMDEYVGKGWHSILTELCEKMSKLDKPPRFTQIKEKFGLLRIYTDKIHEEADTLIHEAEKHSGTVCENCGQPGKLRTGGWWKTLCEPCNENKARRWEE